MIRYLRSILIAARFQPYVPTGEWNAEDAELFSRFLASPSGTKFRGILANMTINSQNSAITQTNSLQHACGYATGFRGCVSAIEALVPQRISETDEDTDSLTGLEHLNP